MNFAVITALQRINRWQPWLGSVVLSMFLTVPFVAAMSWLLEKQVTFHH